MPSNLAKTAALIRSGRLAKGLTQLELAELTNISLRSIQRIEKGEVTPRSYTVKTLAQQLDIELDFTESDTTLNNELRPDTTPTRYSGGPVKTLKIIWSVGIGLLLLLFSAAFLSQSTHFPETTFETFLFWAGITFIYTLSLSFIWKASRH